MIDSEIIAVGTEIANAWLRAHGYYKINTTHVSDYEYIEADGKSRRIFIKLKVAEYPHKPGKLTEDEVADILLNASVVEREPWVVEFQVDERKQLLGDLRWQNLGKK